MFADFLKIIQELVLGFLDALLSGLEVLVGQFHPDEAPAGFNGCHAGAAGSHESVQDSAARGADGQKALQQLHGLLGLMEALLRRHYGDVVDARHGLGAFGSLPVNRQVAVGAPDHELAVVPEAPRLVSADAFVPYDDAPPHPAGHLHGVRHRREVSPVHEHLQDPPPPSSFASARCTPIA